MSIKSLGGYLTGTIVAIGIGAGIGLLLGGTCSRLYNNKEINYHGYTLKSYPTGISGHQEITVYADGSIDVICYPSILLSKTTFLQDLNGDRKVDRIRKSNDWKSNAFDRMLVREYDYDANHEQFDAADRKLQELIARSKRK